MTITVSRAQPEQADTIARFNQNMALETENKHLDWQTILSGVETMISDPSLGFYFVAINPAEEVVGCLGVTFEWSDWRNGLFWWVQSVYVDKNSREQGVFTSMYAAVKEHAMNEPGVIGIRLYVERDNDRAYRTYLRLGMSETEYRLMEALI